MTSRERLLTALACEVPDRVPVSTYELAGYNSKAWENNDPSYARLMQAIREKADCVSMWNPGSNAVFMESSYPVPIDTQQSHENTVTFTRRTIHTPKGDLHQAGREIDGIYTTWQTEHLCKSIEDVDKTLSVPYEPVEYDASDYDRIKREVGDNGIIMASLSDPLGIAAALMEFGSFTIWAMTETGHFARTVAMLHERVMENLRRMLAVNVVDLYRICGPEYATPPYLPPVLFRKVVVPYVAEMVDLLRSKGGRVRFHCHGRIRDVLDMIFETGADSMDPCEAPPTGDIALAHVKKRIGKRMCIFGNIHPVVLEHGTVDDVRQTVKDCMEAAKEGGGYTIMPTAAPINTPLPKNVEANYLQYLDAALEFGGYV